MQIKYTNVNNLKVSSKLFDFVNNDLLAGTEISPDYFWSGFDRVAHELAPKNKELLNINVNELVLINEMSMTIGLVMLTIGNFLGGMWANESWGRYWGWDPKETWALISIMVYAFVIHMRLIPGLKSNFAFTVASILSFGSIIMTYFGVNFYLAGLHSYAKDDQEISVVFISITLAIIFILSLLAYPRYKKYLKNNR